MPKYGNFRAWVTVDDNILRELDVKVDAPSLLETLTLKEPATVTCWIPSEVGKVNDMCTLYLLDLIKTVLLRILLFITTRLLHIIFESASR